MKSTDWNEGWSFGKKGWEEQPIAVTLPHDAMIHEQRLPDAPGGSEHGFFPGGVYVYEKEFVAPETWRGQTVAVYFEGVYRNARVLLNGRTLAEHAYGYAPFTVELTGQMALGEKNLLRVEADNSLLPNSRWYSGSGVYRPVKLLTGGEAHIAWQGVRVTTVSYAPAVVRVQTSVTRKDAAHTVTVDLLAQGKELLRGTGDDVTLTIPDARLWNEDTPFLYQCRVRLWQGDTLLDEDTQDFGVRVIEWSNEGLRVNGRETLLRGGCVHHDNGILGACAFPDAEERRVRILKENGFNAIRSAHNLCSESMLRACDKYGVFLMDEAFDMWYMGKTRYDYHLDFDACWQSDVRAMVERDYNHPSVILLSIGNEVSEPSEGKGVETGKAIVDLIHSLDATRPVTCGANLMIIAQAAKGKGIYKDVDGNQAKQARASKNESKNVSLIFNTIASFLGTGMNKAANSRRADRVNSPFLDCLDIAGYNYASGRYVMDGKLHPKRVIFGSETFPQDIAKNWAMVEKLPYLVGDFMWAGWDYLGEAGIGAWSYEGGLPFARPYPWLLAGSGVIDLLGQPDVSCRLAQLVWKQLDRPVLGVQPVNHPGKRPTRSVWRGTNALESWSWRHCEGNRAVVEVYARGTHAELLLNGQSLGRKKLKGFKATFHAPYQPGVLQAVAWNEGQRIGQTELVSAQKELRLQITPEIGEDLIFAPIRITDANGVTESAADRDVTVTVEGGELLALGSANPKTEQRYDRGTFSTYYGTAMAVVRRSKESDTRMIVRAEGLDDASCIVPRG